MASEDAVIVSSVRTPVGRAKKGALAQTLPTTLGAEACSAAVARVKGLDAKSVDDVLMGCAMPEGEQGLNIGRLVAQRAGFPDSVPGATVNRFCSSGLQTIAMAAQAVTAGHAEVIVAGGTESMSMVPMGGYTIAPDPALVAEEPNAYISMGLTAEVVAARHKVGREAQDAFAVRSHERAVAALEAGTFADELVPMTVEHTTREDDGHRTTTVEVAADDGPRGDTSVEALAKLKPAFRKDGTVTAGNSSQMSDGAAASVVMSAARASKLGATPLARMASFAVAGVAPDVMGIGPVEAVPKALRLAGIKLKDVGLVELNEAFASQSIAIIQALKLDEDIVNVNGGAIALGHPLGCTGAKLTATLLHEMKRRGVKWGVCTMCVGGGMGAAAVFENLAS